MADTTLITIPFSHFCEKSRWMLDLAGVSYVEDPHLPMFHRRATRRFQATSVPVLVTRDEVLRDSSDIALWVDRRRRILPTDADDRASALAFEADFDKVLGPHLRRFMYFHLFKSSPSLRTMLATCPKRQARIATATMPLVKRFMAWSLKLTADGTARSLVKVRATFDAISQLLADGRPYLVGSQLTVADLTFAALASPILMPAEHPLRWPTDAELPDAVRALRHALRQTPAGLYGLRIYRDHRNTA